MPDVKLSAVIKKRPIDVRLNNERFEFSVEFLLSFFDQFTHFASCRKLNTGAPVSIFPWFHYPDLVWGLLVLSEKSPQFGVLPSSDIIGSGNKLEWVGLHIVFIVKKHGFK